MFNNIHRRTEVSLKQDDMLATRRQLIERKPDSNFFYELEEAVVLDVILDEAHPYITKTAADPEKDPPNIDGSAPLPEQIDYSWIGAVRFRFLRSQVNYEKNSLDWALPMENTGIVEYPLMNEIVIIGKHDGKYFYTRKLNTHSTINSNANFSTERMYGGDRGNINTYSANGKYSGPESKINFYGGDDYVGILGNYFKFNPKIRTLKPYEGDTILQSRFGSSIRFGAYDGVRGNDNGLGDYADGGGNPMILIRNRQAPIRIPQGISAKGYTIEDINSDGSSIHITSGKTKSRFTPTTAKPIISGRRPATDLPRAYDGDQIVINSDRIILSSKVNEMLFFSKKRLALVTDEELTLDCIKRMTITSMKGVTINSPKIYLGEHAKPYEPAVLGRTMFLWLDKLAEFLLLQLNNQIYTLITNIIHWHIAFPGTVLIAPPPALLLWADQLQSCFASQISLIGLQYQLPTIMSTRVFVAGGID